MKIIFVNTQMQYFRFSNSVIISGLYVNYLNQNIYIYIMRIIVDVRIHINSMNCCYGYKTDLFPPHIYKSRSKFFVLKISRIPSLCAQEAGRHMDTLQAAASDFHFCLLRILQAESFAQGKEKQGSSSRHLHSDNCRE